jgi:hypothetical protein
MFFSNILFFMMKKLIKSTYKLKIYEKIDYLLDIKFMYILI